MFRNCMILNVVPEVGLEPTRLAAGDFESGIESFQINTLE